MTPHLNPPPARGRTFARSCAVALLLAGNAFAATPGVTLDVPTPYLPSTQVAVDEMLRLAGTGPDDLVVDLGSGDGRVVIAAARDFGARGLGIEIDPKLVAESEANARRAGVAERVAFRQGDVLRADYRAATVVTLYLLPNLVDQLKPRLLAELKPGTRIVAHDYGFSDWKPDRSVVVSKTFHLYVVPARVAGRWRLHATLPDGEREYSLEFEQRYQELRGGARVAGGYLPAFDAKLAGDRIAFVLVDDSTSHRFEGTVQGALSMEGTVRSGPGRNPAMGSWRATRVVGLPDEG
ncbi:MAG TPA: class I SAM-dependent methyltransferase [Burkholderiales bacterium]